MVTKRLRIQRHGKIFWVVFFLVLSVLLSACERKSSQAILDGQVIFNSTCNSCHTIGGGNLAGPDLKGVTQKQSQEWLLSFISDPGALITAGDPTANDLLKQYNFVVMPDMGLTNAQIQAVIQYIDAESALAVRPTPVTTAGALPEGNADNGRAIFLGDVHLQNGGPFCIGCHSINGLGILGGGTLGPNLTDSYTKYGDAGLEAILSNLPFLTMRPIFSNNSPTAQERADLRAFIKSQAGKPQVNKEPIILAISLGGFLVLMALSAYYWRHRLQGVRQPLVARTRRKK